MIIKNVKNMLKWVYKEKKLIPLVSFICGLILTWLIKNNITQLFFQGKSFNGRNLVFKGLLIFFCTCLFSILLLVLFNSLMRINRIHLLIDKIENRMLQMLTKLGWSQILLILSLFVIGLAVVQLISSLDPQTNDDAFVYYTYARNLTEGRPFSYDVRNIPSEGFTSLLYLLLLTPFEFFKTNMTFASVLINLVAIAVTMIAMGKLVRVTNLLTRESTLVFLALLCVFIVYDVNVKASLEWGLETMLGPLITVLAGIALVYSGIAPYNNRGVTAFFVFLFFAYIIRPESMIFIAAAGLPLLLKNKSSRKEIIKKSIIFAGFFTAYHILKLLYFGDIMPTGFYRKIIGGSGYAYVLEWISAYKIWLLMLGVLVIGNLVYSILRRKWLLIHTQWVQFFVIITITTLLFFTQTNPLVGNGYRFLMIPIFVLYILLSLLLVWFLDQIIIGASYKKKVYLGLLFVLLFFCGINVYSGIKKTNIIDSLNIYSKSVRATQEHKYLQFGNYLHSAIPNPENITLVFGDAGAIPYSFGGRFIDSNGLTEPAIAHLFLEPDGDKKTQAYVDYILSQHPDIVVLAWGENPKNGIWFPYQNAHSPFKQATPIDVYKAYQEYGIVYSCSISLYYDLHIGLWNKSPNYSTLQKVFRSYCDMYGYVLPNGLTISDGSQQVLFPNDPNWRQ